MTEARTEAWTETRQKPGRKLGRKPDRNPGGDPDRSPERNLLGFGNLGIAHLISKGVPSVVRGNKQNAKLYRQFIDQR
jgi:hypothetical protein